MKINIDIEKECDKKDIEEQEFWEWCGYKGKLAGIEDVDGSREGKLVYVSPPMDLNSLFKVAVPKVLEEHTIIETYSFKQESGLYYSETEIWDKGDTGHGSEVLKGKVISKAFVQDFDLDKANTQALYQAIQKARRYDELQRH